MLGLDDGQRLGSSCRSWEQLQGLEAASGAASNFRGSGAAGSG